MKKWMLFTILAGIAVMPATAQDDDMYFVPTKQNVKAASATYGVPTGTYYAGSSRSVDEYNRHGSTYEVLPADTGDIISFAAVEGVYPDSVGDFSLTQQMARWDGYEPSSAYWAGYTRGYSDSWGWHSPWYYSSFYPWYDSYYYWWDPWYWDSWHYGWYSPWHTWYGGWYGYHPWGYYGGWYGGAPGYGYVAHNPGTQRHGRMLSSGNTGFATGRSHSYANGTFGGSRTARSGAFGGARSGYGSTRNGGISTRRSTTAGSYANPNVNFGGSRSSGSGSSYTPSRSSGSYGSSGSGSFGSSRSSGSSGGSFGGGSRSSGGGGSRSGGGSFGGGRR